jgi:hypothetical protein
VIEALAKVYHHDKMAKEQGLSPDQRLRFHQDHSGPVMEKLKKWLQKHPSELFKNPKHWPPGITSRQQRTQSKSLTPTIEGPIPDPNLRGQIPPPTQAYRKATDSLLKAEQNDGEFSVLSGYIEKR